MFGGIGMQEILIVLIVGLLVFGAARLPKIARSLGLGIKEFKKTVKGLDDDDSENNKIKYVQNQPPISQQQYNSGMQQPGFTPNPQYNQNQPGGAGQPQTPGSGFGQAGTQPQSPGQVGVPPQAPGQAMNQNQPQAPGQAANQNQPQAPGQAENQNQPQGDQQQSDDNQQNA